MTRFVVLVLLAACDSSTDPGFVDAPDVVTGDKIGTFEVDLVAASSGTPAYAAMIGKVYDRVQPETVQWTTTMTSGACHLATPKVPYCATPCGSSMVCTADNTCTAYATAQTIGTVHAVGLASSAGDDGFDMTPVANTYQVSGGITLTYPPVAEGAEVRLEAAGSTFTPAFTVRTTGIAPLAITDGTLALDRTAALVLHWNSSGNADAKVHVKLDISHHGGTKGMVECDTADSGSVSIDTALVAALMDLGVAGYPTIIVTRSATGSANVTGGHVDFVIASGIEQAVDVPGVQSCTDTTQCPMGETCQDDQTCT